MKTKIVMLKGFLAIIQYFHKLPSGILEMKAFSFSSASSHLSPRLSLLNPIFQESLFILMDEQPCFIDVFIQHLIQRIPDPGSPSIFLKLSSIQICNSSD